VLSGEDVQPDDVSLQVARSRLRGEHGGPAETSPSQPGLDLDVEDVGLDLTAQRANAQPQCTNDLVADHHLPQMVCAGRRTVGEQFLELPLGRRAGFRLRQQPGRDLLGDEALDRAPGPDVELRRGHRRQTHGFSQAGCMLSSRVSSGESCTAAASESFSA